VKVTEAPEQIAVAGVFIVTDGTKVGFTVILKVLPVPAHPFAEGVIVTVAVTALVPLFVAVKAGIAITPA